MATDHTPVPVDRKRLRSQRLREVNFQGDALRLRMNWTEDDLGKPQVLVESAYGMGPQGDGTCLLTVVHDQLEGAPKTAASVGGAGWMRVLSGLKTLVETGEGLA